MKISFITPSYNNLEYLKICHNSLLEFVKDINWEHCIADDGSSDGTLEWLKKTSIDDKTIKFIRKEKRTGHTELYNELVKFSTGNIIMIFHADMFLSSENTIKNMLYFLKEKMIISATRIEPIGMYPESEEKRLIDFGSLLLGKVNIKLICQKIKDIEDSNHNILPIESIFAPWMCYKKDYLPMDKLYSPFPHEDEDVFLRFLLNGYKVIQVMNACIAHFCSRGHRKTNPENPIEDNSEYKNFEEKARRNYIRKWQSWMKFKKYQYPIVPKVFNIGIITKNLTNIEFLRSLEPWCSNIYLENKNIIADYILKEQPNTLFDLSKKIKHISSDKNNDILIEFDFEFFNKNIDIIHYVNAFSYISGNLIAQLSDIISETNELGQFVFDNPYNIDIKIKINSLNTYEKNLIYLDDPYYTNQLIKNA